MTISNAAISDLVAQHRLRLSREWEEIRVTRRAVVPQVAKPLRRYHMKTRPASFASEIAADILEIVPASIGKEVQLDRLEDRIRSKLKGRAFESIRECFNLREEVRRLNKDLRGRNAQLEAALEKVRDLEFDLQICKKISQSSAKALSSP